MPDFDWNTSLLVDERDQLVDRVEQLEAQLRRAMQENNRLRSLLRSVEAAADYLAREQAREDGGM